MVDSGKAPYVFDSATGILRINGKQFRLKATAEAITEYGGRLAALMGAAGAIGGAIDCFARGEWKDYSNAGEKIRALNAESRLIRGQLVLFASEFNVFFEPAGVRAEFGEDASAFTQFVKSLLLGIAEVGMNPILEKGPAAVAAGAPDVPAPATVEAPAAG